jgi:hypothetical protein
MYSRKERETMVQVARGYGMSDTEILKALLANELGATHRRELVVEWGEIMGLKSSEALRIAAAANLIPTAHPPRDCGSKEMPQRTAEEDSPE